MSKNNTTRTAAVFREVMAYCQKRGLIQQLKKSFSIPEEKKFNKRNINKGGLSVLDAVHCLYDKNRTKFFINEINKIVPRHGVIIEAGIGTGILSFCAAAMGATVYGCEINSSVLNLAKDIQKALEKQRLIPKGSVKFFLKNALDFIPPQKADVLISENIYTGMFFESQVQIMKHLSKFLKKGGKVIPQNMTSHLVLSQINSKQKNYPGKELVIPSLENKIYVRAGKLSKAFVYDSIDFGKVTASGVNFKKAIPITKTGTVNALLIYSEVKLPSGKVIKKDDTIFFNNQIYITVKPELLVKKGSLVKTTINYGYAKKPKDASIALIETKKVKI